MATVKQTIAANTGAGSRATQYKKSAAASARASVLQANLVHEEKRQLREVRSAVWGVDE